MKLKTKNKRDKDFDVRSDSSNEAVGMICTYCWEIFPVGTDSCGKCGNTKIVEATECHECGTMIPHDASFCNDCGATQ